MLVECKNCGAPLDVAANRWFTTCDYCSISQRIAKPKRGIYKTAQDWRATPAGWSPPTQWTPPPQAPARSVPLTYNPTQAQRKGTTRAVVVALLGVLISAGVAGVVFFVTSRVRGTASAGSPLSVDDSQAKWDGKSAFECDSTMKIKDVDVTVEVSPAIVVRLRCNLTIEDSTIKADKLWDSAGGNGSIRIIGSRLTLREEIKIEGNRNLNIERSTLRFAGSGPLTAFHTTGNGGVHLERSEVHMAPTNKAAVVFGRSEGNGSVNFKRTKLRLTSGADAGTVTLFHGTGNGAGYMERGELDVGGGAVTIDTYRGATLSGVDLHGSKLVMKREKAVVK